MKRILSLALLGMMLALPAAAQSVNTGMNAPAQTVVKKKKVPASPAIKDAQTKLSQLGFDPGRIDGKMGARTRAAIRAFQKANNLKANGYLTKATRAALSK